MITVLRGTQASELINDLLDEAKKERDGIITDVNKLSDDDKDCIDPMKLRVFTVIEKLTIAKGIVEMLDVNDGEYPIERIDKCIGEVLSFIRFALATRYVVSKMPKEKPQEPKPISPTVKPISPDQTLAQASKYRTEIDVVKFFGNFTVLHRSKGSFYKGDCPLCCDAFRRTHTFVVSTKTKTFFCSICAVGGDPVSFIGKLKELSLHDSVVYIRDNLKHCL